MAKEFKRKTRRAKSCPFCGEKERLQMMWKPILRSCFIICLGCLASGPMAFYKSNALSKSGAKAKTWATRKWNNRSLFDKKLYTVARTKIDVFGEMSNSKM